MNKLTTQLEANSSLKIKAYGIDQLEKQTNLENVNSNKCSQSNDSSPLLSHTLNKGQEKTRKRSFCISTCTNKQVEIEPMAQKRLRCGISRKNRSIHDRTKNST